LLFAKHISLRYKSRLVSDSS